MTISAIRKSGESVWNGTPSKKFLDQVEAKQSEKSTEFTDLLRNAIIGFDRANNRVEFRMPKLEEME